MRLTNENIRFIDSYLNNSGVIYYDIRTEMLDHVATAVEQKMVDENLCFYDAFKYYMIVNKKELLKSNKKEGLHFKEPLKKFSLFVIKPFQLVLALCVFIGVYFSTIYFGLKEFYKHFFWFIIISYLVFGFIHFLLNRKKKFYYIDKNFSILFLLFQIGNLLHRSANENTTFALVFNSIVLFVFISFLRFYYVEMKLFKQKNKFLFQ